MESCPKCGKQNDVNARQCLICGNEFHEHERIKKSKNYMVSSVLLMLTCNPFGIVSFIYALKVNSLFAAGNYEEMKAASRKAGLWMRIGTIISIAAVVIVMTFLSKAVLDYLNQIQEVMKME